MSVGPALGSRERVVFVTCHVPYPPWSGGRRRELELIRRVSADWDVELWALCKEPDDHEHADRLREWCVDVRAFEVDPLGDEDALAAADRFRIHCSRAFTDALRARLASNDCLVHVEGSYLMRHLPAPSVHGALLVEQNVESSLWTQRAARADGAARERCLEILRRTRSLETRWWRRAGACVAVSDHDASEMRKRGAPEVTVVPDGSDHIEPVTPGPSAGSAPAILMVSNFAYEPNLDAAAHLVHDILPRVRAHVPHAGLLLVGNPGALLRPLVAGVPGVFVSGRVDSVEPFRREATVAAAPHRVGGGVKVQVLEALGCGQPLVATDVALRGLPDPARRRLTAVRGAGAFADAVCRALLSPSTRAEMAERSRAAALALPTWDDAATALLSLYASVRSRRERAVA